jgi:hypothetical protein
MKMQKCISFILLITITSFHACEKVEEDEITPLLKFDQTFNVSIQSGWNRGVEVWPTACLWLSTDSVYSSSMIIHTTASYDGSAIIVSLDSIVQPEVSLPAFLRARGIERIMTTPGTHELIFINGNVENSFALTSLDSSTRITPVEITYMQLADEGDFWHPIDP